MVNMRSPGDDRTARAVIRDEALCLFAEHGAEGVSVRAIADAAGVSPALIIRHYGSKDGLREAVDQHVVRVFEMLLTGAVAAPDADPLREGGARSLAASITSRLPPVSPIPRYLGRLFVSGGAAGHDVFRRLFELSKEMLGLWSEGTSVVPGGDPDVRAAFLLINDLALLILRPYLTDVLGVDVLSGAGLHRWSTEVTAVYRDGLSVSDAS